MFLHRRLLSTAAAFGQPHWSSHPHIVSQVGELTPGLLRDQFAMRRATLAKRLPPHSVAMVASYGERIMSNDIPYEFRQSTAFLYLTGFLEPNAMLVLETDASRSLARSTVFVQPRDATRELWDGARTGAERAADLLGVDAALPLAELPAALGPVLARPGDLFYDAPTPSSAELDKLTRDAIGVAGGASAVQNRLRVGVLARALESMRVVKSDAEIAVMQRSATIAARAFADVLSSARAGDLEASVSASLDYHCRRRGAARLSFPPVVAGGRNALTIHYITNDALLRDGDVVLLDGGCEFGGYVSDISRAFPVAPKFSDGQRDVYERVLDVNRRCIALCDLSSTSSNSTPPLSLELLQTTASRWLTEHLLDMGILKGTLADNMARRAFQRFYPHNIGHWLGMDTHDTPQVPTTTPLQPSMCITIEPGLYIGAEDDVPARYRNIGIRVEDDIVLRTGAPPTVLTSEIVKDVAGIEALRAKAAQQTQQ
jgi:Xaa-Pro aminopeptidase